MKIKGKRKIHKKMGLPGAVIAFKWVSCLVYLMCFVFTLLTVGTSRTGISKLTKKYVDSTSINNKYFEFYIENGFTEDMCVELLENEFVKEITAEVMADRMSSLFDNNAVFLYDKDYCESIIKEVIKDICKDKSLSFDETTYNSLTVYTCDICGISSKTRYDTPISYRKSLFGNNNENYDDYKDAFSELSFISSPIFPITLFIMYIICVVIMCLVCNKKNRDQIPFLICDTVLYPSILALGISFGGLVGLPGTAVFTDYIFTISLFLGIIGTVAGVIVLVVAKSFVKKD